jgi:tetratricopeptide (TPR) repeat protein
VRNPPGAIVIVAALGILVVLSPARACINDSDTDSLTKEKKAHPTLANAILSPTNEVVDVARLTARIKRLREQPKENDPGWWNDLAGAYLRLGQPGEAVKILEPLTNRFAGDYGIHANLGTAYHLLGRYVEAEREIARDLEINPEGHFGLEKYHLALLQYLMRDEGYRLRHVFVDEFTQTFLAFKGMEARPSRPSADYKISSDPSLLKRPDAATDLLLTNRALLRADVQKVYRELSSVALEDQLPGYLAKWDLGGNTNLEKGVIYMATLNQKEPACWVMLGILATASHDKHLTLTAYAEAIALGSIQTPILRAQVEAIGQRLLQSRIRHRHNGELLRETILVVAVIGLLALFLRFIIRGSKTLPA